MTPDEIRDWGRYADTSPTYSRLVESIATDSHLLRVLDRIEHTPKLNVLFAGVQYLMMRDGGGELAVGYANFPEYDPDAAHDLGGLFRIFVLRHEDELVEIGHTRYTQTNECRRCVALLPAMWMLGGSGFHLVDLGASAGPNLVLDRYRYRWGETTWGPESPVLLQTENRGEEIVTGTLEILSRTGLDLDPVDPGDADDRLWLEALIWPEHRDRRLRLRAALRVAGSEDLTMVAGNALETLGPVLSSLPMGEPALVMHSFALNQFSARERDLVSAIIEDARRQRRVTRVSFESIGVEPGMSAVEVDDGSGLVEVGRAQHHGEWVEFYARP